jgi:hypothetical protein
MATTVAVVRCHIHDEDEKVIGSFLVCFECKHVYMTEQELIDAYNEVRELSKAPLKEAGMRTDHIVPVTSADDVSYCGLCLHDIL